MTTEPTKICIKCSQELPLSQFGKRRDARDGHRAECKKCKREYLDSYYAARPEKAAEWANKAAENYRNKPDFAEMEKQRHRSNYVANPEKRRASVRKSYQKHAPKRRAERREYREKNLEMEREKGRQWCKANPEKVREMVQRRRARKKSLQVGAVNYAEILKRDGHICHLCLEAVAPGDVQFDHMVPLSKGGAHAEFNIAVAHSKCNLKKQNKELISARYPQNKVP